MIENHIEIIDGTEWQVAREGERILWAEPLRFEGTVKVLQSTPEQREVKD